MKSTIKHPHLPFFTEGGGRYKTIKRAHLPFDFKRSSKWPNDWNDSVCCLLMSMLFFYKIPTPPPLPSVRGRWTSLYPVGVMSFSKALSLPFVPSQVSVIQNIKIIINNVIFDNGCLVFSRLTVQKTDFGRLAWVDSGSHSTWYRGQYSWGWHMIRVQVRLGIVPEITAIR